MATITKTLGAAAGRDFPTWAASWAGLPDDVVASGNSYVVKVYPDAIYDFGSTELVLSGKNTDASHTITYESAFRRNQITDAVNKAFNLDATNGIPTVKGNPGYASLIRVDNAYVTLRGLQFHRTGGADKAVISSGGATSGYAGFVIDDCVIRQDASGQWINTVAMYDGLIRNSLLIVNAAQQFAAIYLGSSKKSRVENCTIVRPSSIAKAGTGVLADTDGAQMVNCAVFGFTNASGGLNTADCANTTTDGVLTGTGLSGLVAANQFVDPATANGDFRTRAGSALINAGAAPAPDNMFAPVGVRQQGTSADIGAWEYPDAIQAPTATVTSITVNGTTVTIQGTTTGNPTGGSATISPAAMAFNAAESMGPTALTLGTGTFSVQFAPAKVGRYSLAFTVANANYTVAGTNPQGDFNVPGAYAVTLEQTLDGQVLVIQGQVAGGATSGTLHVIPDPVAPAGARAQDVPFTIAGAGYYVETPLSPGKYAPSALTFTNAAGTSLPQPGTRSVTIIGVAGNPVADGAAAGDNPAPAPTVTGVTVSPATAIGSAQFSATVAGTNNPPQGVTWSVTGGGLITSGGAFTAPAPTASVQTITVKAASLLDPSKFGTATVTIAAVVTPPPDVDPPPDAYPPTYPAGTVAVTILAADQKGNLMAGADVIALLDRADIDPDSGYITPREITVQANDEGVAVLHLWPNARGLLGSQYLFKVVNPDTGKTARMGAILPDADCFLHRVALPPEQ